MGLFDGEKKELNKKLLEEFKNPSIHVYNCPKDSTDQKTINLLMDFLNSYSQSILSQGTRKPSFRVFWITSDTINALTYKSAIYKDTYYIGLYRGLKTKLVDEIVCKTQQQNLTLKVNFSQRIDYNILQLDNTHSDAEIVLSNFAFVFVVMHEIGHIICGHDDKTGKTFGYLEKQAKELWADYSSLSVTLNFLKNLMPTLDIIDLFEMIKLYMEASHLWLTILDDTPIEMYVYECETHPHPLVRLLHQKTILEENEDECYILETVLNLHLSVDTKKRLFDNTDRIYKRISSLKDPQNLAEEEYRVIWPSLKELEKRSQPKSLSPMEKVLLEHMDVAYFRV